MLPLGDLGSKHYLWYKSSKMRIAASLIVKVGDLQITGLISEVTRYA